MPSRSLTDGMTIQPTHAADDAAPRGAASTTGRVAVPVPSDLSTTPISSASAPHVSAPPAAPPSPVSSHPRLDAMIASAPSVSDAAAGVHPHPDGIHASSESPLIFPLPPLDGEAWTHPLFPGEHSASGPQGVAPVQVTPPPPQNRTVDVLAALVIDLAVLGLLGYLVSRGHLRIDFAGIMALVGLVLHHRRAVPVLPRLFPR